MLSLLTLQFCLIYFSTFNIPYIKYHSDRQEVERFEKPQLVHVGPLVTYHGLKTGAKK